MKHTLSNAEILLAGTLLSGSLLLLFCSGCKHQAAPAANAPHATAAGTALVESSGGKQIGPVGSQLEQPVVVQVNDAAGNAVAGAAVKLRGPDGVRFDPAEGITDSSGQLSSNVSLGGAAGRYQIIAASNDKSGKEFVLKIDEIATGYQQGLGYELDQKYCTRCHSQESTTERVSNFDNLSVKPHLFTDGDTLNKMTDAELLAIINHGGPSLNRSALMPPYEATLNKAEVQALIAYIRLISDPPYRAAGVVYGKR